MKPSNLSQQLDKEMAVLQEKVSNIEERLDSIDKKLDAAIACKADKTEVEGIRADIDKMKSWVLYSVAGGIIVYAIIQGLGYIKSLI